MRKLRVAVLFGGNSTERKVSLSSGANVIETLNRKKYTVLPVEIAPDGITWVHNRTRTTDYAKLLKKLEAELVFIALHGPFGEDGKIQSLLETLQTPYTGAGVEASRIGMDKIATREVFKKAGIKIPKYRMHHEKDSIPIFKKPSFVQTDNQGSSIGASIAKDQNGLERSLKLAHKYSKVAVIDQYIEGIEITCAILGNTEPVALPVVEIVPKHEFFDYECKYNPELVDEICPAGISKKLTKKAQDQAILAYKAIGCTVFGRVDMIVKGETIYVLEINTIPGLTPVSLFPKAAKVAGISYSKLLDKIIDNSLNVR